MAATKTRSVETEHTSIELSASGRSRLQDAGKGVGRAMRGFKAAIGGGIREQSEHENENPLWASEFDDDARYF